MSQALVGITTDKATSHGVDARAAPVIVKEFRQRADQDGTVPSDKNTIKSILSPAVGTPLTASEAAGYADNFSDERISFEDICNVS